VHGCADELAKLLKELDGHKVVLLGDLFTKGPDPLGVWSLIQEHRLVSVLGNHDVAVMRAPEKHSWLTPEILAYLQALPLMRKKRGFVAVHAAVHPKLGPNGTQQAVATLMRRFPNESTSNPFWYDAGWKGPECVVFGHDAVRGLVRRERKGRPIAIGLDTGCVYGGQLSAYLADQDRVMQVKAKRAYKPHN
jgi:diadenosine tetraphosphatase ApaH/serine/threonine PP2A family protein phosphatase